MKPQEAVRKFDRLLEPEFRLLERNTIVPDGEDYVVFGRYRISKNHVYKHTTDVGEFSSCRVALSWCIADKFQQHRLAEDILHLEQVVNTMTADVRVREHLARRIQQPVYRENIGIKISHKKRQLSEAKERLDKCINLAKYLQIRGFNNETARTGRPTTHRTNR